MIVQDLTAVRLAREIAPDMKLHGSTQMSITDARGVELARSLGVDRVTLARELSLEEIRTIAAEAQCDLEIFVHGALCVAYSGQCFSSEAWGGRSANRGQCAQACRLPYELLVDGSVEPLADARYLLSPGDLYALRQIPEIVDAGIAALKIEGRYKDADYVALTTRAYRQAVDEAWAGRPLSITPREELHLEQVYSRGLGPFFLTGTNHQTVVEGRAPRHRGVEIGTVTHVSYDRVTVAPSPANDIAPLKPGDGVVFDAAAWRSPEEHEEGGRVSPRTATRRRYRTAIRQRRHPLRPHPRRRPPLAHPRSRHRPPSPPVPRSHDPVNAPARQHRRRSPRSRTPPRHLVAGKKSAHQRTNRLPHSPRRRPKPRPDSRNPPRTIRTPGQHPL